MAPHARISTQTKLEEVGVTKEQLAKLRDAGIID